MRRIRSALSSGRRPAAWWMALLVLVLVACGSVFAVAQDPAPVSDRVVPEGAGASGKATAGTGSAGPGKTYVAKATSTPPTLTAQQRRQLQAAEARSHREG